MITKRKMEEAFRIDEKLMDGYHNMIVRDSDLFRRSIKRSISAQMKELVMVDGLVTPDPRNQAALLNLLNEGDSFFDRNGFQKLQDDIYATFNKRLSTANRLMKNAGLSSGAMQVDFAALPVIESQIKRTADKLSMGKAYYASRIQEAILGSRIFSNSEVGYKELVDVLASRSEALAGYAHTVANTELMALDNTIRALQADQAGILYFRFTGPVDSKTREFCLEWVGRVETLDFWAMLENPTGPNPVSEYRGGYNCRHRLLPWNPDWPLG